jgi:uncharacterized protein (DUF305 family)
MLAALVAAASPGWAQTAPGGHEGHAASGGHDGHAAPASSSPVIREFEAAGDRMHRDMGLRLTGDADRDFAQAMIPHHQGAIDMARIVLEHGRDPELRDLARGVIEAQEKEIEQLRDWLARNPGN